jgi:hypothetical protein
VSMGVFDLPADTSFEFIVGGDEEPGFFARVPLTVAEANLSSDTVVGVLTNDRDAPVVESARVIVACFDADGSLLRVTEGSSDQDRLEAGGRGSFTVQLFGEPCGAFAVGASSRLP